MGTNRACTFGGVVQIGAAPGGVVVRTDCITILSAKPQVRSDNVREIDVSFEVDAAGNVSLSCEAAAGADAAQICLIEVSVRRRLLSDLDGGKRLVDSAHPRRSLGECQIPIIRVYILSVGVRDSRIHIEGQNGFLQIHYIGNDICDGSILRGQEGNAVVVAVHIVILLEGFSRLTSPAKKVHEIHFATVPPLIQYQRPIVPLFLSGFIRQGQRVQDYRAEIRVA